MSSLKKIAAIFLFYLSIGVAASPTNIKESEYLPGCKRTCQADAQKSGIAHLQSITKCDCYCKNVWKKLTNQDVDFFVKNNSFSSSVIDKQLQSFSSCFK
jgi:hypothetical protein